MDPIDAALGNRTTTESLSALMQVYYDKLFLKRAKPVLVMDQFGQIRRIPPNTGKIIQFTKYLVLPKNITPLTEGTNPNGINLSAVSSSATVAEYGDWAKISSLVSLTAMDPDLKEKTELFAQQAAESMEYLSARECATAGTVQLASGKADLTAIAATDTLASSEIRKAVRQLKRNKGLKINGKWICVIGSDTEFDFQDDPNWKSAQEYAGSTALFDGEIGTWFGVRFVYTTEQYSEASTVTVYSNLMFGAEAFGLVPLANVGEPKIIVKKPDSTTTSDPLNRYSTVGWVATRGQKVLNADWIINIKTGASS